MIRYDIPEPKLSKDFNIDDIHKVRHWYYERTKNATRQERMDDSQKIADSVLKRMGLKKIKRFTVA